MGLQFNLPGNRSSNDGSGAALPSTSPLYHGRSSDSPVRLLRTQFWDEHSGCRTISAKSQNPPDQLCFTGAKAL